jgi:probable F420-dependent oxidoreductase
MNTNFVGKSDGARNTPRLGRIGIWSGELRIEGVGAEMAAELDALGFGALWVPGGPGSEFLDSMRGLLSATRTTTVATGILNIWQHNVRDVAAWHSALPDEFSARFLLGLGVSHSVVVGEAYGKPLAVMEEYLTKLAVAGVSADRICLAALGPKMLALARARAAGAHPYLVTPEHTAIAREVLGPGRLLAPEQGVVLESDPARARELARPYVRGYGRLPNYANSWRRLGFSEDDITNTSDRLVDALYAWGDAAAIADRVNAHFAAGADHVCVQVASADPTNPDLATLRAAWRALAQALL